MFLTMPPAWAPLTTRVVMATWLKPVWRLGFGYFYLHCVGFMVQQMLLMWRETLTKTLKEHLLPLDASDYWHRDTADVYIVALLSLFVLSGVWRLHSDALLWIIKLDLIFWSQPPHEYWAESSNMSPLWHVHGPVGSGGKINDAIKDECVCASSCVSMCRCVSVCVCVS